MLVGSRVLCWRRAGQLLEALGEVSLIGKPHIQSYFRNGLACAQKNFSAIDSHLRDVGVRRKSQVPLE
jgi:hypothetical protein